MPRDPQDPQALARAAAARRLHVLRGGAPGAPRPPTSLPDQLRGLKRLMTALPLRVSGSPVIEEVCARVGRDPARARAWSRTLRMTERILERLLAAHLAAEAAQARARRRFLDAAVRRPELSTRCDRCGKLQAPYGPSPRLCTWCLIPARGARGRPP